MRSISYDGVDLSDWCSAEVLEPAGHALEPRVTRVAGRPGALLAGSEVPPRRIRVRLFLDAGATMGATELADARRELRRRLLRPAGGALVLPGDPGLTYEGAVATSASEWTSLAAGGSCLVEFTCADPIAYGREHSEAGASFVVGGTWETWPVVTMTAAAGASVRVADQATGRRVLVSRAFLGGERVVVDMAAQRVDAAGAAVEADVDLSSDFFPLAPGPCALSFSGCASHLVGFRERWA